MLMNLLPLIVVIRMKLSVRPRNRLRRFISLEALVQSLLVRSAFGIAQSLVAEHQVVVSLQVFGVDLQRVLERGEQDRTGEYAREIRLFEMGAQAPGNTAEVEQM